MTEGQQDEVPRIVRLKVNRETLEKNLDGEGMHHVIGEDGTHVVIRDSEGEPSEVESEPMFKIVRDEDSNRTVLGRLRRMFA